MPMAVLLSLIPDPSPERRREAIPSPSGRGVGVREVCEMRSS
jgi:hypothetical protein